MKKSDRIYINQWLALKPYSGHKAVDEYYLKLCNKVYDKMKSKKDFGFLHIYLIEEEIQLLACFIVSWFEDLISNTNIWNTFVRQHEKLYHKKLPFYPTDEYFEGEINEQDIAVLIWYFVNSVQDEFFLNPYLENITNASGILMEIFEDEWETAPENSNLLSFYQLSQDSDYYKVRKFIDTLIFKTYLFFPDIQKRLSEMEAEIIEEKGRDLNFMALMNENRDSYVHAAHTKLLSLKGNQWAAALLGENHPLYRHLLEMTPKVQGLFLYKGQDEEHITLEHIASSKKFPLLKSSFDHSDRLTIVNTIVFMGLVRWKDAWWFSGVFYSQDFDERVIANEKKSVSSLRTVAFLDHQHPKVLELLKNQKDRFLEFNNGSFISFLPTRELKPFYKNFFDFYNKSLGLSAEGFENTLQKHKKEVAGDQKVDIDDGIAEMADDGLAFFNPHVGVELAIGICSAFPSSRNPFFEEDNSEDSILALLESSDFSKELVFYCLENYGDRLPFFREGIGKKYLKDIDFLLRFWKGKAYHTQPPISLL